MEQLFSFSSLQTFLTFLTFKIKQEEVQKGQRTKNSDQAKHTEGAGMEKKIFEQCQSKAVRITTETINPTQRRC